jgi:glucose dehydrogenase
MLVTKTLLFSGEGLTGQPFFRAIDKKTGEIVWETKIPTGGTQTGLPMTYMHNGRQFIVFTAAAGDATGSAQLVAYAMPAGGGAGPRGGGPRGGGGQGGAQQ